MEKFNFITDERFRQNLESDLCELTIALEKKCTKSVLILAGSIIEAILIDYLISLENEDLPSEKLLKWDLNKAISTCFELNIISEKSKNLSDVVRSYRNLIHPGKSIRTNIIPDENDAIIANSLVEIIIKEVGEKKQESYGFTAEQILLKIESDSTSEVIWHHLIKKINSSEKKRLLSLIKNRYFEVLNNLDYYEPYPDITFNNFSKFFKVLYKNVEEKIKSESAKSFLDVIQEGSDIEVKHNIEYFFILDFINYLEDGDKQLVKDHLFGLIQNDIGDRLKDTMEGISDFYSIEEWENFNSMLIGKTIQANNIDTIKQAKVLLFQEYIRRSEDHQAITVKLIEKGIKRFSYNERLVKNLNDLKSYVVDDLPF